MSDKSCGNVVLVVLLLFLFGTGFVLGGKLSKDLWTDYWRQEAVKRGFAEYNSTNGAWQWKQPAEASHDER